MIKLFFFQGQGFQNFQRSPVKWLLSKSGKRQNNARQSEKSKKTVGEEQEEGSEKLLEKEEGAAEVFWARGRPLRAEASTLAPKRSSSQGPVHAGGARRALWQELEVEHSELRRPRCLWRGQDVQEGEEKEVHQEVDDHHQQGRHDQRGRGEAGVQEEGEQEEEVAGQQSLESRGFPCSLHQTADLKRCRNLEIYKLQKSR